MHTRALVLFSGGQDSTTCLADALTRFEHVETIGFDYGQRHHVELAQRTVVLREMRSRFLDWAARLGDDHLIDVDTGEVVEFLSAEIEELQRRVAERYGYEIVDHHLVLFGRRIAGS